MLKVHSVGYNAVANNMGLSSFESCEILQRFELIVLQRHPRSSILVPIESIHASSTESMHIMIHNSQFLVTNTQTIPASEA